MTRNMAREKNPAWRGGRFTRANGYVYVLVGKEHHLAGSRGYAREHRLVMEEKLSRRLRPGEVVHHKDDNRSNNCPSNLKVHASNAEHTFAHSGGVQPTVLRALEIHGPLRMRAISDLTGLRARQVDGALQFLKKAGRVAHIKGSGRNLWALPNDPMCDPNISNPIVACGCGCGEKFRTFGASSRPRRFVSGHHNRVGSKSLARAKLTHADVVCIRARASAGESFRRIARDFPVKEAQIGSVVSGKSWTTVGIEAVET